MIFTLFLVFSLKLSLILGQDDPTVTIPDGVLIGTVGQTVGDNTTYYAFRGIPFAQEPVGELRFAEPVQNDPWNETLDATADKDVCTQMSDSNQVVGSEDCLHINVYTTNLSGSLPVMVWIYGGSFTSGSSSYSDFAPDYIIEGGVVYVAFNYRLGVFGFLSTEDTVAYGNWGIKDQILALKWVQNNIAYFGGDPTQVTIFGESAGAASVSYLVQSTLTTGLFQRAIMQSGTTLCSFGLTREARTKAFSVGTTLGIVALTSTSLISQLREVDYQTLKIAEKNVTTVSLVTDNMLAGLPFGVVLEVAHDNAVHSDKSYSLLESGSFLNVDLIVGFNSNEGGTLTNYVDSVRPGLALYDADNSRLAPVDLTQNAVNKLLAGSTVRSNYFGLTVVAAETEDIIYFITIDMFMRPVREYVRLTSAYNNVYYYLFAHDGTLGNPNASYTGVGHADELNYLFASDNPASSSDIATREKMVKMWTNFAISGSPTPLENDTTLDSVTWEPNSSTDDATTTIKYLLINDTLSMETNPSQDDWEFYQNLNETYSDDNYSTY